jgi:hypothetical protein
LTRFAFSFSVTVLQEYTLRASNGMLSKNSQLRRSRATGLTKIELGLDVHAELQVFIHYRACIKIEGIVLSTTENWSFFGKTDL